MSIVEIVLVLLIAFLAGMEGILDEFQFHQPLVACTLIGLVTGNLEAGIVLGGTLQMIALGWANIGAAVAPDAALASVASAIILVAVGYALVINMMATKEVWPFFIIGFVIAAISQLTLIALGALGVAFALIYLHLSKMGGSSNGGGGNSGDPLGDILNDY